MGLLIRAALINQVMPGDPPAYDIRVYYGMFFLLALAAKLHYEVPLLWFLIHVAVAALFAVAWRRSFGRGPLERVMGRAAGAGRGLVLRAGPGQRT